MVDNSVVCPIKGCNLHYTRGILGWHKHVERVDAHPYWNPTVLAPEERKRLYVEEFPQWFDNAVGHQTPAALRAIAPRTPTPPPPRAAVDVIIPPAPQMPTPVPPSRRRERKASVIEKILAILIEWEEEGDEDTRRIEEARRAS